MRCYMDCTELRMQGSSGYDYDELLALSCDACSEQVRQNKLSKSGISYMEPR